jgi:hypothetical protein
MTLGLESTLGVNMTKTLYSHFQNETGSENPIEISVHPELFLEYLRKVVPGAAVVIESTIVNAIRSSFILPKDKKSLSLTKAISLARIPILMHEENVQDEFTSRVLKCVQYSLRETCSDTALQVIFEDLNKTSRDGLIIAATHPERLLSFLKEMFGPLSKTIEASITREIEMEFEEDLDSKHRGFVDTINRLRMKYLEREVEWKD